MATFQENSFSSSKTFRDIGYLNIRQENFDKTCVNDLSLTVFDQLRPRLLFSHTMCGNVNLTSFPLPKAGKTSASYSSL